MTTNSQSREAERALPMVPLGRTGKRVSRYGLGGFHQIEISAEVVQQVVAAYLAFGGNYIEPARNYGTGASEEKIGRALEGRRDQVVLCSKTAAETADDGRRDQGSRDERTEAGALHPTPYSLRAWTASPPKAARWRVS